MAEKEIRPIIIVRRRRGSAAAHHGGAWKVAYADFVTAMMAFFLVLWLITTVSKEQRAAIFEYFKNPSMEVGKSLKPAPAQQGPGGASTSPINLHGGLDAPRTAVNAKPGIVAPVAVALPSSVEEAKRIAAAAEHKQLESLMTELHKAIEQSETLRPFKDQLLLDITSEGLRIQVVDQQNRPMFDLGSSRLKDYTDALLRELARYLNSVPNRVSISGHTDLKPYLGRSNYSNWELSADRANAARRALEAGGLIAPKIARVVGLSSSVPFNREDPQDPINRRISIIVMTKQAEESVLKTDAPPPPTVHAGSAPPAASATPDATRAGPSPGAAPAAPAARR
jgi:chemotaxis protein MotB